MLTETTPQVERKALLTASAAVLARAGRELRALNDQAALCDEERLVENIRAWAREVRRVGENLQSVEECQ